MALVSPDAALERYELLERIAVGGMAEVFRARASGAHGFQKTIAIKRILPRLVRSEEFVKRFIAEAKLAVQLTHANIVQILDFGRSADSLFIAMEYVDGPDLARLAKAYGELGARIPVAAALHVALELCKGLDFAHRRGVIHRDISHANILLSMAGEVKIADFGIAKAVGAGSSLTMSRRIMGKWRYMSPEQTRGDRLDARSDIFSAGVVLHELCTGLRLFDGRNIEEIVGQIREMAVPAPSSLRPDLPAALDAVVLRALARDRDQRYDTASTLVHDLTEVCFAERLVPTAIDLAEAIGQAFRELAPTDTGEAGSPIGVDAAIAAALGGEPDDAGRVTVQLAGPGVASPARVTGPTRVLSPGPGPRAGARPASAPTLVVEPARRQADDDSAGVDIEFSELAEPVPDLTRTTFVRGAVGADGLPEWQLPAGAAPPAVGRRWLVVAMMVVGLVGAAGGIALWLRAGGSAGAGRDAAPLVQPVAPATESATESATEPATESATESATEPATEPEPTRVTLTVTSDPTGATVWLDRDELGTSPLSVTVAGDGARHRLRLRKSGYRDLDVSVTLTPGDPVTVERQLVRAVRYGTIDLYAEPWAHIYFRGRKVGTTPKRGLRLPVGRHRLELRNPVVDRRTEVDVVVPGDQPYQITF